MSDRGSLTWIRKSQGEKSIVLVYADRSRDMRLSHMPAHTHRNKVQGHYVQLCLMHCGTLGNMSRPCKHSKHVLGCTHTICTAASTHFFTHTGWHGLACTWATGNYTCIGIFSSQCFCSFLSPSWRRQHLPNQTGKLSPSHSD